MADLSSVEIFAEGTWNGNKITAQVLQNIVTSFNATKSFIKPVLKLGHNDEQTLLANDGLPAAGWVSNVYIKGKKLLADFVDIPEKIFSLIQKKAYRKVSVEIFSGYRFNDETYPHLLGAVALLGADTPAVQTLNDILANYKLANFRQCETINAKNSATYSSRLEHAMPELEQIVAEQASKIEALQAKIAALMEKIDTMFKDFEEVSTKKQALESDYATYKKDTTEKLEKLDKEKVVTEVEAFSLKLETKDLLAPSMLPYVKEFLLKDRSDYKVGEKSLSRFELLETMLELAKEVYAINQTEKSVSTSAGNEADSVLNKKIEQYALEHKVSYSEAYRAVKRG